MAIEYYVLNPQTQTMVRRQMKLNLLRSRYTKAGDFRRHANEILFRLNAKLRNGWSPLMEQENGRLYVRLDDVLRAYIDEKRRELVPADVRQRIADYFERENPYMLTVCELVFTSLIRPKEIRCIRLADIDLEGKFIRMAAENAKTHNERFCALSPQLIERLRPLCAQRLPRGYYLFGEKYAPAAMPIAAARFRKDWDKMRTALKLPQEMQLYSLRDTGINNMLKAGIDPLTVMQHADHHDLSMTTRYANHADPTLIRTICENAPKF